MEHERSEARSTQYTQQVYLNHVHTKTQQIFRWHTAPPTPTQS